MVDPHHAEVGPRDVSARTMDTLVGGRRTGEHWGVRSPMKIAGAKMVAAFHTTYTRHAEVGPRGCAGTDYGYPGGEPKTNRGALG